MAREERRMGGCKITDWWTDWKGKGKRLRVENMLWRLRSPNIPEGLKPTLIGRGITYGLKPAPFKR